jgi:indoleamine 2,3-dioxygenase
LQDIRQAQRAHHVLTFLQQFYVQSLPPSEPAPSFIVIPAPLAIPLVAISRHLSIAPIVTYADTVLWNYCLKNPLLPLSVDNIGIRDLFTGDTQEEHFFLTSAKIEIRGWEALEVMDKCLKVLSTPGSPVEDLASDLERLAVAISDIADILDSVRDGCDPHWFYFTFRPVSHRFNLYRHGADFFASGFVAPIKEKAPLLGFMKALTAREFRCSAQAPAQDKVP